MNSVLRLERVEKYYGSRGAISKAVDDISFEVAQGEFLGVMGPSGSGKTTLLNMIAAIDTVSAGHILIGGQDVTKLSEDELSDFRRTNLGFIFQNYNLLDTLTLGENISLALTINRIPRRRINALVAEAARRLGIEDLLNQYPGEVSGGQQQRCACARALVTRPKLILADEPTGALDSKNARLLLEQFLSINRELSATLLMVTHDAFSASYCSRILFLKDGRIFNELIRGEKSRRQFFQEILDVMSLLGGDFSDVR